MTIRIVWASAFTREFLTILRESSNVKRWYYTDSIVGSKHLDAIVEMNGGDNDRPNKD